MLVGTPNLSFGDHYHLKSEKFIDSPYIGPQLVVSALNVPVSQHLKIESHNRDQASDGQD